MSKQKKKKGGKKPKQEVDIDDKYTDEFVRHWKAVIDLDSSYERNAHIGMIHIPMDAVNVSKLMTVGKMLDLLEWTADVEHGIDPPFEWARIPLPRGHSMPLPMLGLISLVVVISSVIAGVRIGGLIIATMGFVGILFAMAITLATHIHDKSGKCLQCGIDMDDELDTKVLNSKGEEVEFSDAGLCDPNTEDTNNCEWNHYRHGMWVTIYHQRLDSIFVRKNRVRIGVWKDPFPGGNGAEYTLKDRQNPYDREDKVLWERVRQRQKENDRDLSILEKRRRKRRLSLS